MKYRVHLGWKDDYMFDSADDAMKFAISAKVNREDRKSNIAEIVLLSESDLEAENEEGDDD